jgi:hypothetical protein
MRAKFILILALAASLGGCASLQKLEGAFQTVTGNVVTPQAVFIAINAFDAVEATAKNYINLPRCGTGPTVCRDPAITASVIKYVRAGRTDRNQLKAALRANPSANVSLLAIYQDLGNTTAALTSALASK